MDDLFSRIGAVTVEQADAAIRKYFTAGALQFCLIGPAPRIRERVAKYTESRKEISIATPGVPVAAF